MYTVYAFEVIQVIKSADIRAGDTIPLFQSGGVFDGVAYETAGDPVINVGATYLYILAKSKENSWYGGAPWGRYPISADSRLQPVDEQWSYLPVVAALTGLTPDEAAAKISAAAR